MPCRYDGPDDRGPSKMQRELANVLLLLDELYTGQPVDPALYGTGNHPEVHALLKDKEKRDERVAHLCSLLKSGGASEQSLEMQLWWRDHQLADARRQAQEEAERLAARELESARSLQVDETYFKNWCRDNRTSQAELARKAGIDKSIVNRIIKGGQAPSLDQAVKIARAMSITVDELALRLGLGKSLTEQGKATREAREYERLKKKFESQ